MFARVFLETLSRRGHTHVLVLFSPRQFQIDLLYRGVAARVHCTQHLLDFDNCVHKSGTASDQLSLLSAVIRVEELQSVVMYFLPRYLKFFLSLSGARNASVSRQFTQLSALTIPSSVRFFFLPGW